MKYQQGLLRYLICVLLSLSATSWSSPLRPSSLAEQAATENSQQDLFYDQAASQEAPLTEGEPVNLLHHAVNKILQRLQNSGLMHLAILPLQNWQGIEVAEYPAYNRTLHFKGWVRQQLSSNQPGCNTRIEVLKRDAVLPVEFASPQRCAIAQAEWHDPYTGITTNIPQDLDIDHVVPLKNAYESGAYAWSAARRCHYANFIQNNYHLLAVSLHANRSKGFRDPSGYLPSSVKFRCQYVEYWLKIKAVWDLDFSEQELTAIAQTIEQENCQAPQIDLAQLKSERQNSRQIISSCQ